MHAGKYDLVGQLLAAKEASGKTFTQISEEVGLTNAFTAQLFHNQVCNQVPFCNFVFTPHASQSRCSYEQSGVGSNIVSMQGMQAQLKSGREELLRKACPALTDELVAAMKRAPMRGFDPSILKEPHIYRSLASSYDVMYLQTCTSQ